MSLPVTIVVAPAGAGKTSLLAEWTRTRPDRRVTWIGSGKDVTPEQFANIMLAAAGAPPNTRARRQHPTALVTWTAEALTASEAAETVVVDDAHLLSSLSFRIIDELLSRCPHSLRLVLLCRWDPPVARLVPELQGTLGVIRGAAFQMSADEAKELISAHTTALPAPVVEVILERAQGWAAIVVLAARTVAASPEPLIAAQRLAEGNKAVSDLLASQVFSALSNRTRHLLLCIASEATVTAETAGRLSGDRRAGEVLAELEASGLLVTRVMVDSSKGEFGYRVHPLLSEVVRRRVLAGGVAVAQANATVRKAAMGDVVNGDVSDGFRRFVSTASWHDAVAVMADHGADLVLRGQRNPIAAVLRAAPELIEATPRAWLTLALDFWLRSDFPNASHWINRALPDRVPVAVVLRPSETALLRLLRARTGAEPLSAAVDFARQATEIDRVQLSSAAMMSWLLAELGAAESWLGDLVGAADHLRRAAAAAEVEPRLLAAALSHLAQTEYLLGHHHNARVLADRVLDMVTAEGVLGTTLSAARVVRELSAPVPASEMAGFEELGATAPALADPVASVLHHVLLARRLQVSGAPEEAASFLEVSRGPAHPPHIRAVVAGERYISARLENDALRLGEVRHEFAQIGALVECALIDAARQDLVGQPAAALSLLAAVVDGRVTYALPEARCMALVYEAQLADSLGHQSRAEELLEDAVRLTATQRVLRPFLNWSMHGTPVHDLLLRLVERDPSAWTLELSDLTSGTAPSAPLLIVAPTSVISPRGNDSRGAHTHLPTLTSREHDVLSLLAKGSTYADIAEDLFITENTVKTHVSGLYGKLGATRRSEALKAARSMRFI